MELTTAGWIVGGFLICGFGLMSWLSNSIERRSVLFGVVLSAVGFGLMGWSYMTADPAMSVGDIPLAFIEVAAYFMGR